MRFWTAFIALYFAFLVDSFPSPIKPNLTNLTPKSLKRALETTKRLIVDSSKPINTSGKHVFQAPGDNDQRGPCPGLNALANHNYISHDGITSYAEVVAAINQGLCWYLPNMHDRAHSDIQYLAWVSILP